MDSSFESFVDTVDVSSNMDSHHQTSFTSLPSHDHNHHTASNSDTYQSKTIPEPVPRGPRNMANPSDMLGQFSFAPATQTTVVTTTTTTTTSFPPLFLKAPTHLHEMDAKLYPLAASPTPQSLKRFCFDVGGRPAMFCEAEDTEDTLQIVSCRSIARIVSSL